MIRALLVAIAALAGCYRSVTDAPSGTPPLVIKIPDSVVTSTLPVSVRWEASCEETWTSVSVDTRKDGEHTLDFDISSSTSSIGCKKQRFSARASCVPGPCTVIEGNEGKSRSLKVAFGAAGMHALTLSIDNGEIRKSWTTNVEVVIPDAIRLGCSIADGDQKLPCEGRRFRPGSVFVFTAEVYAAGKLLDGMPALDTKGPFVRLDDGRWQAPFPGTYFVHASHDGLVADLSIVVEP